MSLKSNRINPTSFHPSQLKFYAVLIPLALFMILPMLYIVNHAFKPLDELFAFPPRFLVQKPTMGNFEMLWLAASTTGVPMSRYFFNSIVVSVVTVISNMLIVASAGYALSKKKFKIKKALLGINQVALMFVPIAVTIPRYLIIQRLGLINNFAVHILPLLAMPVGLFLVKQFIDQVPDSLVEAAKLDGANDFVIITKIIIPVIMPAMATVGILTFQVVWNSVESSNLFITDESIKTLAFYLNAFTDRAMEGSIVGAGMAAAAALIMFLPNLIIFILMQSRVMNTMSHSGIK
jgi:ABC-type glycerol-3-phosphate transport system permease component